MMHKSIDAVTTAAILNTYLYLDNTRARDGQSLRDILLALESLPDYGSPGGKYYSSWEFLTRAASDPDIGHLIIGHQAQAMGYNQGTNACTFTSPTTKDIFIIYRGTADGEWADNGMGLWSESTAQQKEALDYFDSLACGGCLDTMGNVYVSGHSKGGNKAQYVTLSSQYEYKLHQCISFDGQGFSGEALKAFQSQFTPEQWKSRRLKLYSVCGNNDFVNVFGHSVFPPGHTTFIETQPEAMNFAGYHDIKYLFASLDSNGHPVFHTTLNPSISQPGSLAKYASHLSSQVLALPPKTLSSCAMTLTQLVEMTSGKKHGLHGERLSFEETLIFLAEGLPLFTSSLLFTPVGRQALLQYSAKGLESIYQSHGSLGVLFSLWGVTQTIRLSGLLQSTAEKILLAVQSAALAVRLFSPSSAPNIAKHIPQQTGKHVPIGCPSPGAHPCVFFVTLSTLEQQQTPLYSMISQISKQAHTLRRISAGSNPLFKRQLQKLNLQLNHEMQDLSQLSHSLDFALTCYSNGEERCCSFPNAKHKPNI